MKTYSMRTNKEKSLYNSVTPVNSAREYVSRQPRLDAPGPWKLFPIGYFQKRSEARWAEIRLKRSKGRRSKWLTENKVWRAYDSESNISIIYQRRIVDAGKIFILLNSKTISLGCTDLKKLAVGSSEWKLLWIFGLKWKLMGQPRSSGRFIHG